MAKDLNKVQITGRLGAAPELRYTSHGSALASFRVASNRSWRSSRGESHSETEWFRVIAWDQLATDCCQQLQKGSFVYLEGRLQTRQWLDQNGNPRLSAEVVASDIIILTPETSVP